MRQDQAEVLCSEVCHKVAVRGAGYAVLWCKAGPRAFGEESMTAANPCLVVA